MNLARVEGKGSEAVSEEAPWDERVMVNGCSPCRHVLRTSS